MSYDRYTGDPQDEQEKTQFLFRLFGAVQPRRSGFEAGWEEAASLYWPEYRNTFTFGHDRYPGQKQTQFQVDSSGSIASHRFMAIAETFAMPTSMVWSKIELGGRNGRALMRDRSVREYCREWTELLWAERYRPEANFIGSNQQNLQGLGVFGNANMWTDELDTDPAGGPAGARYISCSVGEVYYLVNHQGRVDGCIRHFRWTPRQIVQRWRERAPQAILAAYEGNSQTRHDILHFVLPRTDYDPWKILSPQGKPWMSCYVSVTGQCLLEEGGFYSLALASGRYQVAPEEDYGRGPGQMVLAEAKTLNAEKADYLKQGHRAAAPALLIGDDGLMDFKNTPDAFNYGGFNEDGKMLVGAVPHGEIQVTKEMMDESRAVVNDGFLVGYFKYLFEDSARQKSVREWMERANGIGIFLAPILGRLMTDYMPTLIHREMDLMMRRRAAPEKPPALREAEGEYNCVWTNPLMRAMGGQSIAGYMRTAEFAREMQQLTGDPEWTDRFDSDASLPDIAEEQFVPPSWMASDAKVAAKRQARAQQAERDQVSKELPGRAAIKKAEAIEAKAATGGNIGGALSGLPVGSMPQMPGQQGPGGRAFGQPGGV